MTSETDFDWIPFYSEMAKRLLDYKDRDKREKLLKEICEVLSNIQLCTKIKKGKLMGLSDIDPFSIFGLYNIYMEGSEKIRLERIRNGNKLTEIIGLDPQLKLKDDFDFFGIPTLLNFPRSRYFFDYENHNNSEHFDTMWALFEVASNLIDSEFSKKEYVEEFIIKFEAARKIEYNGSKQLSIGLFWAYPEHFVSLDKNTRKYIKRDISKKKLDLKIPETFGGAKYLAIRDKLIEIRDDSSHKFTSFCPPSKISMARKKKTVKYNYDNIIGDDCFLLKEKL